MSFVDLRPYFQGRVAAADSDFTEWTDAFAEDNIPSSLMDKAYHIKYGDFALKSGVQNGAFLYDGPVTVNFYFKGYKDPIDAIDTAWTKAETIIQECCKNTQRLSQSKIKNVLASFAGVSQLGATNDNVVKLSIVFLCTVGINVS